MLSKTGGIAESDLSTGHAARTNPVRKLPVRPFAIIAVVSICLAIWGSIAYFAFFS